MISKRGTIYISGELINSELIDKTSKTFSLLGMFSIRAEFLCITNEVKIDGYCDKFDELSKGELMPTYLIESIEDEYGTVIDVRVSKNNNTN